VVMTLVVAVQVAFWKQKRLDTRFSLYILYRLYKLRFESKGLKPGASKLWVNCIQQLYTAPPRELGVA
jgi:hypothetical protein